MPAITNEDLRDYLPAGIALDATAYPDADDCLPAVIDFLRAVESAQVAQNATAPAGEDVQILTTGVGAETTITRDNTTHAVRQVTRAVTVYEKYSVAEVFPILV